MLPGLRFSQVTSKKEWMNRTLDNIGVPKYPSSMEELPAIDDLNKFCFARSMDIESINDETFNIHYTAHQFWEQAGPRKLLLDVIKRLSVNESAFQNIPINLTVGH